MAGIGTPRNQSQEISGAFEELKRTVPLPSSDDERHGLLRLIAIVFSVISVANGKHRNYASRHENIKAMLNTFLNAESGIQIYVLIIERLLRLTSQHHLLGGTVGKHIERAKRAMEGNLCLDYEPEWDIMRYLVPEVFDAVIRDELIYLDVLPTWAVSPLKEEGIDESVM
jgi:hypothetical protein